MRKAIVIASLAVLAGACTRTHRIATPGPLPENEVDHVRGALQGAGIGVLAGAAAGAAFGYSRGDDACGVDDDASCLELFTAKDKAVFGAIGVGAIGALGGLVLGAVVGSRDVYEREEGLVPSVSASVAPGGASASLSWSF